MTKIIILIQVFTVQASDADGGQLVYTITGGNGFFKISSSTGHVTLTKPLYLSSKSSYTLTVVVTDNGGLWESRFVTVNVQRLQPSEDSCINFNKTSHVVSVKEGKSSGVIFQLFAGK